MYTYSQTTNEYTKDMNNVKIKGVSQNLYKCIVSFNNNCI